MKKIVETSASPFDPLLGKTIVVYACRFIYTGILSEVDDKVLVLTNAQIVYDTGEHKSPKKAWACVEPLWSDTWNIQVDSIESFGLSPF
jgi:hypothetical protein